MMFDVKISKRNMIILLGYSEATVMFIVLFYFFFIAYINNYKITVYINMFGEAHLEWFALCLAFDAVIIGLYYMLKNINAEERRK